MSGKRLVFVLMIVLAMSFVSAGIFDNIFGKMTGHATRVCIDNEASNANSRDIYVSGTLMYSQSAGMADHCMDTYTLDERYCDGTSIRHQKVRCEHGCNRGKCNTAATCPETCDSVESCMAMDTTASARAAGCQIEQKYCFKDDGQDIFIKGKIWEVFEGTDSKYEHNGKWERGEDGCSKRSGPDRVIEWICMEDGGRSKLYTSCPGECENGACVKTDTMTSKIAASTPSKAPLSSEYTGAGPVVNAPANTGSPAGTQCSNDCYPPSGEKVCDGKSLKMCGNYDTDNCFEYKLVETCSGNCVDRACTTATNTAGWTEWFNRDKPTGYADSESLSALLKYNYVTLGRMCEVPTKIECRTTSGTNYNETEQKVTCSVQSGLNCRNADNGLEGSKTQWDDEGCLDYEVRYYCPSLGLPAGSSSETCSNECSTDGQKVCSSDGKVVRACGNWDTDSCLEYKIGESCSNGCANGVCKSATNNNAAGTSGDSEGAGGSADGAGDSNDCENECDGLGQFVCGEVDNTRKVCRDYDNDGCLELKAAAPCINGCADGKCLAGENEEACDNDFSCFVEAAKDCTEANFTYITELDFFGVGMITFSNTFMDLRKSSEDGKCLYFQKTLDSGIKFSEEFIVQAKEAGTTDEELASQLEESNDGMDATVGIEVSCLFDYKTLYDMLVRWEQGIYSSNDLKDCDTFNPNEVLEKSANIVSDRLCSSLGGTLCSVSQSCDGDKAYSTDSAYNIDCCLIGQCVDETSDSTTDNNDNVDYDEIEPSCSGCLVEDNCYAYGFRMSEEFCSIVDEGMVSLSENDVPCDNSFECESNLCVAGSCQSKGIWNKFLRWFKFK